MIASLAVAASVAPVFVGLRHELAGWRLALWGWLAFLAAENVVLPVMSWNDVPTGLAAWWCYPVSVALGLHALSAFPDTADLRPWRTPVAIGYTVLWAVSPLFRDGPGFSLYAAPLHARVLSVAAAMLFVRSVDGYFGKGGW